MNKLKVFETFAGIGAQTKALMNIGVQHDVVAISEWNIDSIISYAYIHHLEAMKSFALPEHDIIISELSKFTFSSDGKKPFADISKLRKDKLIELYKAHKITNNFGSILDIKGSNLPDIDLLTYSFPCQAISMAGKRDGLAKGTETSSSLLWEIERILLELKSENRLPSYLLMENVAALFNNINIAYFIQWKEFLASIGYRTKEDVLIATDFGIPQIRERAFAVSILNDNVHSDTISIDTFNFPIGNRTKKTVGDIFDPMIDEKYYLDHLLKFLPDSCFVPSASGIRKTNLVAVDSTVFGDSFGFSDKYETPGRIYIDGSMSPTLTTRDWVSRSPKILVRSSGIKSVQLTGHSTYKSRNTLCMLDGFVPTITSSDDDIPKILFGDRIRTLTPCERMKLMGFTEQDYENLSQCSYVIPDTVISMQCGNSIVVNVLEAIFKNLFFPSTECRDADLFYHFGVSDNVEAECCL
jgi:DNA (cytosine-5)-methyltransferase 1